MANFDPKQRRPAPPPAATRPAGDGSFIGHDAPTVVDASLAKLKEAHDALMKQKGAAAPALELKPEQEEEEVSTGEEEHAGGEDADAVGPGVP